MAIRNWECPPEPQQAVSSAHVFEWARQTRSLLRNGMGSHRQFCLSNRSQRNQRIQWIQLRPLTIQASVKKTQAQDLVKKLKIESPKPGSSWKELGFSQDRSGSSQDHSWFSQKESGCSQKDLGFSKDDLGCIQMDQGSFRKSQDLDRRRKSFVLTSYWSESIWSSAWF